MLDDEDRIIAAAYGATPPPWIRDIGEAEGWALLQAAMPALPGSTFTSDCKVIVDSFQIGRQKSAGAGSVHARVYALLFAAFDDTPIEAIVWMPAHQVNGGGGGENQEQWHPTDPRRHRSRWRI